MKPSHKGYMILNSSDCNQGLLPAIGDLKPQRPEFCLVLSHALSQNLIRFCEWTGGTHVQGNVDGGFVSQRNFALWGDCV